jgi:haloalkane dehalogenase
MLASMEVLRTPDERFEALPGFPFEPRYVEVDGLRLHYVDEGPSEAPPVLMLHGEPSWSYLYRKMIPQVAAAGLRAVAPDFPGFGRSDKLAERSGYSYRRFVDWTWEFLKALDLEGITMFCQDWGGLIGMRLAAEDPDRFDRIVAANTFLPTGDQPMGEAFLKWQQYSQEVPEFPIGRAISGGCFTEVPDEVIAAYEAPFPDETYKEAARAFPSLVPTTPDDPAAPANRKAWEILNRWEKPFLTTFGDSDPITRGADRVLQALIPGAQGRPHVTVEEAGHFLQEDKGEELARIVIDFVEATK